MSPQTDTTDATGTPSTGTPSTGAAASAPTARTWVAVGPAGVVGSIGRTREGFVVRLSGRSEPSSAYPTLAVAKSAVFAALGPGAEYPEFHEH